jgi:hypothetical protein
VGSAKESQMIWRGIRLAMSDSVRPSVFDGVCCARLGLPDLDLLIERSGSDYQVRGLSSLAATAVAFHVPFLACGLGTFC